MNKGLITKWSLIVIVILALGLRVYKLDSSPPSISWDEAAFGYNAWTISNYGMDEYGATLPLFFKSFGDDKHPVHIYITALSVKLLGLNDFSTRLPSALFGTLNVLLIFFLGKLLFKSEQVGLFSSFLLAISPYNIHFSRFNHEVNFMLFFLMLGIILFYLYLNGKRKYLAFSFISFVICFLTYHSAKVIVPVVVLMMVLPHIKKLSSWKDNAVVIFILIIFSGVLFLNPELLGTARISQNTLSKEGIEGTKLFALVFTQYLWHFTPRYLFIQGDEKPKLSAQTGEFMKPDALFFILGVLYLLYKRSRAGVILLVWALSAPIPSSLAAEAPHAARAGFMMGSWHLIGALGFYFFISLFRNKNLKVILTCLTLLVYSFFLFNFLTYYFGEYSKRYAIDWQYGMKQIVEYVKENPGEGQVYMTERRSQPYIFFLYYLKTPLPEYLGSVLYNNSESKSYNLISGFDKFFFGGLDTVEIKPDQGILYILTPTEYDGLKYKSSFEVKKIITYPNETVAFYIIS